MSISRFAVLKRLKKPVQELEPVRISGRSGSAVDLETGELLEIQNEHIVSNASDGLADRYSLQSVSRSCLPSFRVSKCLRLPVADTHHISIYQNNLYDSIFFGGLQTCGSVWHCPVCAAKISERRANEVELAFNYTKELQDNVISFVTRTVPHSDTDSLFTILHQFRKAETFYKSTRFYKKIIKAYGVFGSIKVYEITVGLNGWHLHVHEILFSKNIIDTEDYYEKLQLKLYACWSTAAVKAGFDLPTVANGLQIQNGDFAADYMAKFGRETSSKWNVSKEVSKQHIKKSRSGFSPFDLLRFYRDKSSSEVLSLIEEYGRVMHGQRQLIWSRGLKSLVQITEKTDDDIAKEIEIESVLLGLISLVQWRFILKLDLRVTVLLICKNGSYEILTQFLASIGAPDFEK